MVVEQSAASGQRSRRVRGEWWALALVVLAVIGFALSTPRFASPDESAHQATAWYVTQFGLPPTAEGPSTIPAVFGADACFKFDGRQDASCMPPRQAGWPVEGRVLNYPPPYYWVVGIGQEVAGAVAGDLYLDVGGRLASLALNLGVFLLVALSLRRHYPRWGTYALLAVTPTAAFLWVTVNPSGWETTAGLLFAYVFARAWWSKDTDGGRLWLTLLAITGASILFALARHSAIVWMAGVVVAVIAANRSLLPRARQWYLLAATLPGFLAGLWWQLNFPAQHSINNPDRIDNPQPLDFAHYFMQIEEVLPDRLRQMVGNLGWLDTPVPQWMFFLVIIGWAALVGVLFARTRIPIFFLVVGFLGTFLVPTAMEMVRWNDWPYWYQGRITLPFTLPFLLILLMKFGHKAPRAAASLSIATGFVLVFMLWQNLMRYSFGIWDYIPERWSDPAIATPAYLLTYLCIAGMLVGLVWRWILVARPGREIKDAADEQHGPLESAR